MVTGEPVRLVLVHHAGGSRLLYHGWARHLPASWQITAADAPGRGLAHHLPLPHDLDDVAEPLAARIAAAPPMPLALFGHSMGAAVAARVVALIARRGGPAPLWLGLSGWAARRTADRASVAAMSDDELADLLTSMGGTPRQLLADTGLWRYLMPSLRADLCALAGFDPFADRAWLDVPLSLFTGRDDPSVGEAHLAALGAAARRLAQVHVHPGGHFYLTERAAQVTAQIVHDVRTALAAAPDPRLTTREV
jgi:surfactin synthase thioesterase subunit